MFIIMMMFFISDVINVINYHYCTYIIGTNRKVTGDKICTKVMLLCFQILSTHFCYIFLIFSVYAHLGWTLVSVC